jgi:hypothetical protein
LGEKLKALRGLFCCQGASGPDSTMALLIKKKARLGAKWRNTDEKKIFFANGPTPISSSLKNLLDWFSIGAFLSFFFLLRIVACSQNFF